MRKLGILLVFAALSTAEVTRHVVQFRLEKNPGETLRGFAQEIDTAGFRFERFGGGRRQLIPWDKLVREDAKRLRLRFGIDWFKNTEKRTVPGHRLTLKGGGELEGLLVRVDEKGRHWLKTDGLVLPYPGDRILRVEEIELAETKIYDKYEIYLRRLERRPPQTAAEHRDLADFMFDLGNWERSAQHYRAAMQKRPAWAPELAARVEEITDIRTDQRAARTFAKAKYWAVLQGDFPRAERLIEEYVAAHPESRRRGYRVLEQVRELKQRKLRARFYRVKHEEFDRSIRRYLARLKPDHATAVAWVAQQLAKEVAGRVRNRLCLTKEQYEEFRKERPKYSPHYATYWSGTFIVSKRARKGGKGGGKAEAWWFTYDQVQTRSTWLKAYAAERLPDLFEIVDIRITPCSRCGGRGFVRKLNLNPRGNQPMEWSERCPRCFGARNDRGVAYR